MVFDACHAGVVLRAVLFVPKVVVDEAVAATDMVEIETKRDYL